MRLLVAVFFLGFAAWFFDNGLVTYPNDNARAARLDKELQDAKRAGDINAERRAALELQTVRRKTDTDINIQQFLGATFAITGVTLLAVGMLPRRQKRVMSPPPHR